MKENNIKLIEAKEHLTKIQVLLYVTLKKNTNVLLYKNVFALLVCFLEAFVDINEYLVRKEKKKFDQLSFSHSFSIHSVVSYY